MTLQHESYICDARPNYPLLITAKRYWSPEFTSDDARALTLALTHGTGYHKEQWEPTIDDLLEILRRQKSNIKIREIWTIDAPNHGDAASLNEETLRWVYEPVCEYSVHAALLF